MNTITLNIVEPGSGPTPDPAVPNTGLFTSGIGGPEATAIGTVLILTIAAIVVAILYRKQKKSGKVTKLVHLVDSTKAVLKSKKRITAGLTALALLASAGTLTTLLANAGKSNTNAIEGDGLTLDVSSEELTIEVADEPVFAVLPVDVTVEEATEAGYTLTAYADNTDLVSTTNPDNVIPMVTLPESSAETLESSETVGELSSLTDNTYGLALGEKPTTKDAEVYMPLSIDSEEPTIIKSITDYTPTEANDTTTIYYGFYITPDVPYGTYTGTNINYNAEPHYITDLSFDGNGNDGGVDMEGMTIIAGDTITLPENTFTKEGYNFIGWNTVAEPTEQDPGKAYEDQAEYTAVEGETKDITLYAQWEEELPVIGDLTYMQDFATLSEAGKTSVLNSMTEGAEYQLEDNRDQTMYCIAKLADGNVWMTQNLDLELSTEKTLTPADTDIPENWAPQTSTTTTMSWSSTSTTPASYDPGDLYWDGTILTDGSGTLTNLTVDNPSDTPGGAHYHIGNYYNWTAAVAMNDSSMYDTDTQDADQSICPAGWRLPTLDGDKSFDNLVDVQEPTIGPEGNIHEAPSYFVYGGQSWHGESLDYFKIGSEGTYLTSVTESGNSPYGIYFYLSTFMGWTMNTRYHYFSRAGGNTVRCVAR